MGFLTRLFSKPPVEISTDVYQLAAVGSTVTAIVEDQGVVLVDAGGRGSAPVIAAGLEAVGSSMDRVKLVVLTHHHPDHTGGLAAVVEMSSAFVAAHRLEAPIINGNAKMPDPHQNKLFATVVRPMVAAMSGPSAGVDHELDDGEFLPMGDDIRVVHTPGHTPGSICLLLTSCGVLIVGDALQHRSGRLSPPAAMVTQDAAQALDSIGKMAGLEFDTVAFGHFPPLRDNAREAVRRLADEASG